MRRGTVLLFAVVAAVGLSLAPAGATGSHGGGGHGGGRHGADVLVVDQHPHRGPCHGKKHRSFRTIQAAVDAADPGDTIRVCPGLYEETVTVATERLTIKGANAGRDATRHGRHRESIVTGDPATAAGGAVRLLADDITWDGFLIRDNLTGPGLYTSPDHSGYLVRDTIFRDNGLGLHLGSNGAHPTLICRNRFVASNEFTGVGAGNGIFSNEGALDVRITWNKFERHNAAGILFADSTTGTPQQDVLVEQNKSVDDKTFAAFFASSRVRLLANSVKARVNDPEFPQPASAIFIGARNDDVIVQKNKVKSASGNGIDVTDSGEPGNDPAAPTNVAVLKNKVEHAQLLGIDVSASGVGQYDVIGNRAGTSQVGIHLGPETDNVVVDGNKALGNVLDCQDESTGDGTPGDGTAGTENGWQENVGATDDPDGICAAPVVDDPPGDDGKDDHKKHKKKKHKKHKKKHRPDPCDCKYPRSM